MVEVSQEKPIDDGKKPSLESKDDLSQSSDGSSHNHSEINPSKANYEGMTSDDTRALLYTRLFVALVLLVIGGAAAAGSYALKKNEESEQFSQYFNSLVEDTIMTTDARFSDSLGMFTAMSSTMTALSVSEGGSWPFFTQPDFEAFGQSFIRNTGAQLVSWSPIVEGDEVRVEWGNYSVAQDAWVEQGLEWQATNLGTAMPPGPYDIPSEIFQRNGAGDASPVTGSGPFLPVWQMAGAPADPSVVNYDLLEDDQFSLNFVVSQSTKTQVLTGFLDGSVFYGPSAGSDVQKQGPQSLLITPLLSGDDDSLAGVVVSVFSWVSFFEDIIPSEYGTELVAVVDDGECGNTYSYKMQGDDVVFLGEGDLHDTTLDNFEVDSVFGAAASGKCTFTVTYYPTPEFYDALNDNKPVFWATFVAIVFAMVVVVFFVYDLFLQKRQYKVINNAAKASAIVSSLFPAEIRDRLFGTDQNNKNASNAQSFPDSSKYRLKNYLAESGGEPKTETDPETGEQKVVALGTKADMYETKPIADLFPNTTVMFADIAGFTAWSSVREPSQVFTLLETIYHAFDVIAKRRRVFKVETVGDCYVAVAGLPEPRDDHATVMARFAKECVDKFNELAKQLEITLGPDTTDLAMRAGLHSGPVTAGVLRGDKSRFQLFGDTVNTAARVESTGMKNRVHMSSDTADLLVAAGKEHWLRKRPEVISSKGKGEMQTYWLQSPGDTNEPEEKKVEDGLNLKNISLDDLEDALPPKVKRLVGWNVEILKKILQHIVAKRNAAGSKKNYHIQLQKLELEMRRQQYCLDEVTEIIALPKFDAKAHHNQESPSKVQLPEVVVKQLTLYVSAVAAMHRDNPFHNFEHASHVTMSVSKLLARIVAPDDIMNQEEGANLASSLHDHTYGITSDPLTQFGCVLSALIHDTDHFGVSNFQLIKEEHKIAKFFKAKSVAEQNSIAMAWDKLMDPRFTELRRCIYSEPSELSRFRQLVVNNVLATDIFDKELQTLRRNRWDKAFQRFQQGQATVDDDVNRKATIVMEHLIQASDVAHTMQHWHIYQKWNERLFAEMTVAFKSGRMEKDPADGWYQGELGFFDNYIIPLAKKLKECGVFGVSSDEYLNYALENRREWQNKGEEVVAKYLEKYCKTEDDEEGENGGSSDDKKGG